MDRGLIAQKGRGLTTKSAGIFRRIIIFQWENTVDSVHTIRGPLRAPVHGGLGHGRPKGVTGAQPSDRSGARRLIGGGTMESGVHGESITGLTRARVVMWRLGDNGEEAAVVGAVLEHEERRRREGRGVVEDGEGSPFI
jgi:hypothetical protein